MPPDLCRQCGNLVKACCGVPCCDGCERHPPKCTCSVALEWLTGPISLDADGREPKMGGFGSEEVC